MKNSSNQRLRSTPSKKPISHPKGILVLGMHRSGTSAFTRVLNLLGCALPDSLIGGGDGNETGHWEAISVVSLNDQIFTSAGSRWDDWGPLNDDWRQSSLRDDMLQKAVTLIEDHADLGSLFAIKDPRLCRLADVWLAAMEEAKVEPSAVLMVRNPAEVIASLESRDLMAPGYSQLLWLRHALDAEFFSRGSNRVVCRYDQLMSNWFSVIDRVRTGLGITLPRNSPSVHLEIEQYLNDEHRHHEIPLEAVIDNPALSDWLRRTFAIMINWSEEGEKSSDYIELDQIRMEFDRSYSTFARLMLPSDLAGENGLGPRLKREHAAEISAAQTASREAEARVSAAAVRESELAAEIARLEAATAAANSDVERETQHRRAIEAELTEAQQVAQNAEFASREAEARVSAAAVRESELAAEIARLEAATAAANSDVERETQHRRAIEAELVKIAEKAREHELLNAELSGRLALAESTIVQRQEELSQLMTQFLETERLSARAIAKEEVALEQLLDAKLRVTEATAQINAMTQRSLAELATAEANTGRLQTEIVKLTEMLQKQKEEANQLDAQLTQQRAAKQLADTARIEAEQKLGDRFNEIAQLTAMLADERKTSEQRRLACDEMELLISTNAALEQDVSKLNERVTSVTSIRTKLQSDLNERHAELARITALLGRSEDVGRANAEHFSWLQAVHSVLSKEPRFARLRTKQFVKKWRYNELRRQGLFDADVYLEMNPDVRSEGMDPLHHYVLHGLLENRSSGV
jgi:hypothetical protein